MFVLLADQTKPVGHSYAGRECVVKDSFTDVGNQYAIIPITGKTSFRQVCTRFSYPSSIQSETED